MAEGKLRVLCLHAKEQSATLFEKKIQGLVKKAKHLASFTFIDAPLQSQDHPHLREWYRQTGNPTDALPHLEEEFNAHGPFDGVLGFSQGARLAAELAVRPNMFPNLRFAIIASAPYKDEDETIPEQACVPSLHILSCCDTAVPCSESDCLSVEYFACNLERYEHDKGHSFPCRAADLEVYVDFISRVAEGTGESTTVTCSSTTATPVPYLAWAEEIQMLEAIYGDDLNFERGSVDVTELITLADELHDEANIIRNVPLVHLSVRLGGQLDASDLPPGQIRFSVLFVHGYPGRHLPKFSLEHNMLASDFSPASADHILANAYDAARANQVDNAREGETSAVVWAAIQAADEALASGMWRNDHADDCIGSGEV